MSSIDVNTVIDRETLSSLQKLVLFFGFLLFFCDGLDTGIIGFVAPALLDDWGISKAELAPVLSAALIGMAIGSFSSGPISDRFGRKKVILGAALIFLIFTILCGLANSPLELMFYRLITGIGLGAVMPNISTIVSEYMPIKRKAFLTSIAGCGFMLGISSGGILSAYLLGGIGWANVIIIGGVIPLVLLIILFFKLPESTQYLIKTNQQEKAREILEKIHGKVFNSNTVFINFNEQSVQVKKPVKTVLTQYFWTSVFLWTTCFMSLLVFYLLVSWLPTILKSAGFNTQQFSLIGATFQWGGGIGGAIIGWYMDKVNATKVVRYAYFLAFCLFLISGYISHNILLLGISITVLGGLLGGAQGALLPLAAMSYPSFCRGVGVAWMQGIGRTGAIIGAFFGSFIFSFDLALSEVFYLLSIPACIAAILLTLKVFYESSSHKSK
jgi:AAHS family 4-hydroxybenzoate transporter-like MFS transporter